MDLSELPDYRRVLSNRDDGRRDKVNKTKSQFPDKAFIKPGNSLFASRKIGPLYRKYCDTDNSCFVYGSEGIGTGNSKKITQSEGSSSGIWQDGAKLLGIQRTNPKMASRPEIRVLNESYVTSALATEDDSHLPLSSKSHFATKSNGMEKIGQVSVTLPAAGSSTIAASWKNYHMGITSPAAEHNGNRFVENPGTSNHKNAFNNDHPEIGAREISLKLNKALKKYDGLDKLREKVKRQQLASKENKKPENEVIAAAAADDDHFCITGSSDIEDGNCGDGGSVMMEMEPHTPVRKASHHSRQNIADNNVEEDERHVKVRKIATSVSSPSYKGFSDLKRKTFDKSSNATAKLKPKHTETKVDSRINDKVLTSITTTNTSDKCDSKTNLSEPVSDKNKPHRKDMITPSSWREGQEIIRRVLGPPQKVSTTKLKPFVANQDEINVEERKLTVGARQMLKDLQIHKNSEVNVTADLDEEKDNFPCPDAKPQGKPLLHAVKRKPAKLSESDKQAKVRHYDPEEVRKFIAKKKDERLRKAKEDKMETMNKCVKRQEMLQEVYRKQREATAAAQRRDASSSRCKSKNDFAKSTDIKDNPAFDLDLSVGGSSDLHLNFSDATSTLTTDSHDGSITPQITPRSESSPAVPPVKKSKSFSGKFHTNRTYPRPLSQNLELNSSSRKNNPPTVAASSIDMLSSAHNSHPASYLGQIELSNRRRIMDIQSSAATLTNKLREIYKQTSASDFTPPPPAHDECCYSPPLDILSGTGPTYVGTMLDDNLPGVQSLRLKAQEIYEKKEQDAATRIQAVYRGYTVRKNLKWQHLTGLPDIEDQAPSSFQTNFYQDQSDTSSVDCGLAENSFGFGKAPKFKSLFHQHFTDPQIDSQNHTSYTKEIKEHKHQPRSSTLYPKYPWKDAASDQFSIVNIFTSKYKNLIQTDSDHSSDAATEKHMAKLYSPAASSVSSIGSHQRLASHLLSTNQQQHHNYAEPTSYLAEPVKTDLRLEVKEKEVSIQLEKNKDALLDAEELSHVSSENVSSHLGATRSRSSHKSGSRRGSSTRKKLNLYKVSSKSLHAESHTDTSLQSFSEDSEMDNRSTSEAPLRSQSSMGDSTDSDVSSLLNERANMHANSSNSRLFSYSHPVRKDAAAGHSTVNKRYAPSTLPMRLRAELYNFEQTVETVSLAQQETFSLGQIFQKQQQKHDQELHYWDRLKHAVNLLEGKTTVPTSQMPEHSEALMSGDQSFSLKSITAHEEKNGLPKHKSQSPSTQTHTYSKVIPSTTESLLSNTNISESLYSHSHTKHSSSAGGKYSITTSTSQTESKRPSHRKNLHHSSHRSDESSSSRCSVKTASDVRVGEETSDSIAEDISDGSTIEASSVSMSVSKQPQHHSNKQTRSKEAWKIQLEEEKQRAQKEDAIWQSKLKEVEEKLNSLQHPLVRKELDEVLPELVKRKLVVLDEVPRMMVELKELTDRQELSRKEHYKRVKSLLKSQAKYSESKLHSSRDSSKSDSEIYGHPKATKENGSSPKHDSMGDMYTSKQKCLSEKKLEIQALEKRLKHEEKYLHKLKKETLKKCAEPNVNSSSSNTSGSVIASSIKEDLSEHKEKHNSRRRFDNFSHSSDHSISEALNATTNSLPASFSKGYSLVGGGGKNSISEEIQEKFSQASNSSKSKKQSISVKESSIAEDIDTHSRKDNSHTRKDNSSYSTKTKASASESGDDTATNDEYSRSFETSISSSYRASPVHQLPRPLVGTRNGSLSFKSSRSSRGRRRGSESDTEDSFQSETLSDASDIEVRIRALSEDLKRKKNEADRLRQEKKAKYKEKLKAQEESLIKQIEAYDNYIEQIKEELQKEQEPSTKKGVKPQIKQPKVSESRKFKQISTPDVSPAQMSKRDSTGSSADETLPPSQLSPIKHEFQAETSICSGTLSPRFQATSKADMSKQSSSPLASHIVQQNSSHEGHNTTTTTEIKINSIPEELDEKTVSSSKSICISGSSKITNKESSPSCKEVLNSVRVDSLAELASKESLQTSTKTADKPKNNEDQVDSQQAPPTDQSRHFTSAEISESISEKIETIASSGILSKSSNNEKAILKLNLNEETSSQPVNVASEAEQSQDSVKAKDKPADSTSFSEHYSEDFEVDKTISSQHSQSFDDLDDDEMSQCSLDKTVSEAEQGDEISEQISVHSDTSARTSPSKSSTLSNRQRGVPDGQFDNSASRVSVIPASSLHREHTENSSHSELQENEDTTLSVDIEQQQPLHDSEDVALNKTTEKIGNVVDEILNKFVSESVSTICKIAAGKKETIASVKKAAPPVLPKPKRKNLPDQNQSVTHTATSAIRGAAVNDEKPVSDTITTSTVLKESKSLIAAEETSEKTKRIKQELTNDLMESLLTESIKKVLDVRRRKISNAKWVSPVTSPREIIIDENKITTRRQSSGFELSAFSLDDDPFLWSLSPDSESSDDFPPANCDDFDKNIPRPHSPLPNEPKPSLLSDDITENIWPDLVPCKPPPPYPGHADADTTLELQKLSKEFYAVPQKRDEIDQLVSSAVELFWQDRANDRSLTDTTMPDCFLTVTDDLVSEMDQQSCRSYKKMLFDLTREIIEEVYEGDSKDNDGNNNNNPAKNHSRHPMAKLIHRKCQPVINKYYRQSRSPPSTPEELQKVVKDAVAGLLQLEDAETETGGGLGSSTNGNAGRRRQEFDKWKTSKKDHVDRILIQELQEEEPQWVDYDADVHELKVQLTNTIFDSLLSKTVETFKNIYNRRNQRQQQQQQQQVLF